MIMIYKNIQQETNKGAIVIYPKTKIANYPTKNK